MLPVMKTIEAIYERGVLRPLEPLEMAEGARVRVSLTEGTDGPSTPSLLVEFTPGEKTPYELLAEVAALPTEDKPEPSSSEHNGHEEAAEANLTPAEFLARIAAKSVRQGRVEDGGRNHDFYLYGRRREE